MEFALLVCWAGFSSRAAAVILALWHSLCFQTPQCWKLLSNRLADVMSSTFRHLQINEISRKMGSSVMQIHQATLVKTSSMPSEYCKASMSNKGAGKALGCRSYQELSATL